MSDPHSNSEMITRLKHFTSLRDFLDALDHMNDLQEVRRRSTPIMYRVGCRGGSTLEEGPGGFISRTQKKDTKLRLDQLDTT